jgi:small subunit ribosomal protein S20
MANTKSAAKRARQTKKRTLRNTRVLTALKTEQKRLRAQLTGDDKAAAQLAYRATVSELDRAAKRGIIHKNVVNRRKSRLALRVAALA